MLLVALRAFTPAQINLAPAQQPHILCLYTDASWEQHSGITTCIAGAVCVATASLLTPVLVMCRSGF
eukprot:6135630-Amphidinium_carterae.1